MHARIKSSDGAAPTEHLDGQWLSNACASRIRLMQISLPQITSPLDAMAVCIHIPLDSHPELLPVFTDQKQTLEARAEESPKDPRYLRLLLERATNGRGHFHLDAVRQRVFRSAPPQARASVAEIQRKCDFFAGKALKAVIQSRFEVPLSSLPDNSVVNLAGGGGGAMTCDGVRATLTAATVRFTDNLKSEVRWRQVRRNDSTLLTIEIYQTVDELQLSPSILVDAERKVCDAFDRYVAVKQGSGGRITP